MFILYQSIVIGPIITTVSNSESHQTLQESGRPGDDDENLLDQFGDDGHLLTL